jgi:hypothetical protein
MYWEGKVYNWTYPEMTAYLEWFWKGPSGDINDWQMEGLKLLKLENEPNVGNWYNRTKIVILPSHLLHSHQTLKVLREWDAQAPQLKHGTVVLPLIFA